MRMHRGSSKDGPGTDRASGILPLSASPALVEVELELEGPGGPYRRSIVVPPGTRIREAVRRTGRSPEGCAVFVDESSVPLDAPIDRPVRLRIVPTFSGG
jgi:sulfur carrier protein ThiS